MVPLVLGPAVVVEVDEEGVPTREIILPPSDP
jgi:hypothetical protein